MNMTPVESSMFSAIGYDADGMTLYLEFHATKNKPAVTWAYKNFISERWDEMCAAESVGKWFLANVKGKYDGVKVEDEAPHGETYDRAVAAASEQNKATMSAYIEKHGGIDRAIVAMQGEMESYETGSLERRAAQTILGSLISMRDGADGFGRREQVDILNKAVGGGIVPADSTEEW